MSEVIDDEKLRKEALLSINVADIFHRVNKRTRASVDITDINSRVDVQPVYCLGRYEAVELLSGPALVTVTIRGPHKGLDSVFVEFVCPRCKDHHEAPAFFGDKHYHSFSAGRIFNEATVIISVMEENCEACVEFIKNAEATIAHANEQIYEMEQKTIALQDEIHDAKLSITLTDCRTKDCETCDRRRAAEETARMEALERDEDFDDDLDEDEEEESY